MRSSRAPPTACRDRAAYRFCRTIVRSEQTNRAAGCVSRVQRNGAESEDSINLYLQAGPVERPILRSVVLGTIAKLNGSIRLQISRTAEFARVRASRSLT